MLALEGNDCVARVWFTWLASFGSIPNDVLNKVKIKGSRNAINRVWLNPIYKHW